MATDTDEYVDDDGDNNISAEGRSSDNSCDDYYNSDVDCSDGASDGDTGVCCSNKYVFSDTDVSGSEYIFDNDSDSYNIIKRNKPINKGNVVRRKLKRS